MGNRSIQPTPKQERGHNPTAHIEDIMTLRDSSLAPALTAQQEISLRNHLCLSVLRTEYGRDVHLMILTHVLFASFRMRESGVRPGHDAIYIEVDSVLSGMLSRSRPGEPISFSADTFKTACRLLELYDQQLQTAPMAVLIKAHEDAAEEIMRPRTRRVSIVALIQQRQFTRQPPGVAETEQGAARCDSLSVAD